MIKFLEKLLNIIYIQSCYFCKSTKDESIICKDCYNKIHFLPPSVLRRLNNSDTYACCIYDGIIKKLIRDLKYNNKKKLAPLGANFLYEYIQKLNLNSDYVIIPVPISKGRLKERHYNHMDIIAEKLSKLTKHKTEKNLIIRIKDTKKQYKLHKQERIENIKDAFKINTEINLQKNTPLLIIDDITSTGITFQEIIKELKNAGYNEITAIALSTPDIWN